MAYTVMINDGQRKLLVEVLGKVLDNKEYVDHLASKALDDSPFESQLAELTMLAEMLDELPEIEKEDPGIVHGLCL